MITIKSAAIAGVGLVSLQVVRMASKYPVSGQSEGSLQSLLNPTRLGEFYEYISHHLKAPLSILIIGETGSGKSTLVNNLLGEDVAKVGKTTESETSDITLHKGRVRGVDVRIFDTPGLRDSRNEKQDSRTLEKLKSHFKSGQFSLVIFCFPLNAVRMSQDKIDILKDYHKIGIPWHRTFIALTLADTAHLTLPENDPADAYEIKLVDWWERITTTLTALDGISEEVAEKLKERVFPTTYKQSTKLPNGQEWYTPMWISILEHMDPEATALFLKLHRGNITSNDPVRDKGSSKSTKGNPSGSTPSQQTGFKRPEIDVDTEKFNLRERFKSLWDKILRTFTIRVGDGHDRK